MWALMVGFLNIYSTDTVTSFLYPQFILAIILVVVDIKVPYIHEGMKVQKLCISIHAISEYLWR
jgi:hypothetical protein